MRNMILANPVAAMAQGGQAADQMRQIGKNRALDLLYSQQGAGIANGDAGAINALAGLDPMAARQINQQQFQNDRAIASDARAERGLGLQERGLQMREREFEMQVKRQAAAMTAQEREAEAAQIEQGVKAAATAQSPEQWDQIVQQFGQGDLVGQFENREAILSQYISAAEIFKGMQPEGPLSPAGKVNADIAGGYLPEGTPLSTPSTVITNNTGANETEFRKTVGKSEAEKYTKLVNGGMTVATRLAQVDQIESLLNESPSGIEAAMKYAAGEFGITTEGLSELQAAQALINKLVPEQRQPGSGPMSDADLELFKQSLPRLINTPEGNKIISQTMRGLLIYEKMQADIANQVINGQISRDEGNQKLANLQNPLLAFKRQGQVDIGGYTIREVE